MIHPALPVVAALALYYVFAAAAGAMLPPLAGQERTVYGYLFRFVQQLAANGHRLAESRLSTALTSLAASAAPTPAPKEHSMILITTVEHGVASAIHDITVGAKATAKAVEKIGAVVQKDAPTLETLTALVDPRAAVIERVGAAILGEILPQIETVATNVGTETTAPTVSLSVELFDELKSLASSLVSEIAGAKAAVASTTSSTVALQAGVGGFFKDIGRGFKDVGEGIAVGAVAVAAAQPAPQTVVVETAEGRLVVDESEPVLVDRQPVLVEHRGPVFEGVHEHPGHVELHAAAEPICFPIPATPEKIVEVRGRLGIPAGETIGTVKDPDVQISFQITATGVNISAVPMSFKAKMAAKVDPGEIQSAITKRFLGA